MLIETKHTAVLEGIEAAYLEAVRRFEQGNEALYRNDGTIYSRSEHTRRYRDLESTLRQAADNVTHEVNTQAQALEDALLSQRTNPLYRLTPSQMADFERRRPLIMEDCESLPLGDLVTQIKAINLSASEPERLLWLRYGERRYRQEAEKSATNLDVAHMFSTGSIRVQDSQPADPHLHDLRVALSDLGEEEKQAMADNDAAVKAIKLAGQKLIIRTQSKLWSLVGEPQRQPTEIASGHKF